MSGYTWVAGAAAVVARTQADWDGVWSLLYAAGKASFRLSLQVPFSVGAPVAFAAMDVCQARDEVGWAHPSAPVDAIAVDLGPLGPALDLPATVGVIVGLLNEALSRLTVLDRDGDELDRALVDRLSALVRSGRAVLAEHQR